MSSGIEMSDEPMEVSVSIKKSPSEKENLLGMEMEDSYNSRNPSRWIFSDANLSLTPSRLCSVDSKLESYYRRFTARFILDLGRALKLTQLVISTGTIYMHRFFMYHSFTKFNKFEISIACIFLGSKIEEQFRLVADVCHIARKLLVDQQNQFEFNGGPPDIFTRTVGRFRRMILEVDEQELCERIVDLEAIILTTLGFDVAIQHAQTYVINGCKALGASPEVSKKAYCFANQSLVETRMCLRFSPAFVACVCIYAAAKVMGWSVDKDAWWMAVDVTATKEKIEQVARSFIQHQNGKAVCLAWGNENRDRMDRSSSESSNVSTTSSTNSLTKER